MQTILDQLDEQVLDTLSEEEAIVAEITDASEKREPLQSFWKWLAVFREPFSRRLERNPTCSSPAVDGSRSMEPFVPEENVKLPDLKLRMFNGEPATWSGFWDVFRNCVHSRPDLSGANKFQYLTSCLEGDAALLIDGFEGTDAHYAEAIELLEKSYGLPHLIQREHLHALFNLTTPATTVAALSTFRGKYECHLRGLRSLKLDVTAAGFVFAELILCKLPQKIRDNINRKFEDRDWDLDALREAVCGEITHLRGRQAQTSEPTSTKPETPPRSRPRTTGAFAVATPRLSRGCFLCNGDHRAEYCHEYPTIEDRKRAVNRQHLCRNCLRPGAQHHADACPSPSRCRRCKGEHHTCLCERHSPNDGPTAMSHVNSPSLTAPHRTSSSGTAVMATSSSRRAVALPTAWVEIRGPKYSTYNRAFFDLGAQESLITRSLAEQLHLKPIRYELDALDGHNTEGPLTTYPVVLITLATQRGPYSLEAYVAEKLPSRISVPGRFQVIEKLKSAGIAVTDDGDQEYGIATPLLIGGEHFFHFITGIRNAQGAHVLESTVGPILAGDLPPASARTPTNSVVNVITVMLLSTSNESRPSLDQALERLWQQEALGIMAEPTYTEKELQVLADFRQNLVWSDGKYVASFPWKIRHPPLQTNAESTQQRLRSLLRKLRLEPANLQAYDRVIRQQLDSGYIEEVTDPDDFAPGAKVHYLPHRAVYKDSVTTPLLVVFDASARSGPGQPSLNDCLFSGPSLNHEIPFLLIQFRKEQYAAVADIAKAYLQIGLTRRDQDSTRFFFWPSDVYDPRSPLKTYRFKVVLFGTTCSQFLLNATLQEHLSKYPKEIASELRNHLYVDNVVYSAATEDKIGEFYDRSRQLLKEAGFNLGQWATNSPRLTERIITDGSGISSQNSTSVTVLGLSWVREPDELYVASPEWEPTSKLTKRIVVSEAAQVFDPLGWLAPVAMRA